MFESYHEKYRVHLGTPGNVLFGSKRKSVTRFSRPFSEIRENWYRKITNSKHTSPFKRPILSLKSNRQFQGTDSPKTPRENPFERPLHYLRGIECSCLGTDGAL